MASNQTAKSKMDALVIGAARKPTDGNEMEFRMWDSVFADIKRMYKFCAAAGNAGNFPGSKGDVRVYQTLVSWDPRIDLSLTPPDNIAANCTGVKSLEWYQNKQFIRDQVCRFLQESPGPNFLIYFSGHGLYQPPTGSGFLSEGLSLPSAEVPGALECYDASELTKDISDTLKQRREDNTDDPSEQGPLTVYLVIDACHAEGVLNFYELGKEVRLDEKTSVILFAGAERRLETAYDPHEGGAFTRAFCQNAKKGERVSAIAEGILGDMYTYDTTNPGSKTVSPCVRYSRPNVCDQVFLG